MRKIRIVFIVAIIIIMIVPIITFNIEKDYKSEIDNRYLAEINEISSDSIDEYINDRIGLREKAIKLYNYFNSKAFDVLTHPDYMYGKNGEIFSNISSIVAYSDYHKHFLETVKEIQNYCEDRGVDFYFVFDPSKANAYTENLPETINYDNSWLNDFIEETKKLEINLVDNYEYFLSVKNEENLYNKEYDVSHWSDNGAFWGTNNLYKKINEKYSSVTLMEESDFKKEIVTKELIPSSNFSINEDVIEFHPLLEYNDESDTYINGLEQNRDFPEFYRFEISNEEKPEILLFAGSYYMSSDRAEKFMTANASILTCIHSYQNIYNIDYYLNIFDPDIVIFEVADYVLGEWFYSEYYMETMNLQPAFKYENYEKLSFEGTEYRTEENGEYITLYFENPAFDFDYMYLLLDEKAYDCIKYDNNTMFITFTK